MAEKGEKRTKKTFLLFQWPDMCIFVCSSQSLQPQAFQPVGRDVLKAEDWR